MKAEKLIQAYCNEVHTLTNVITVIAHELGKSRNVSAYKLRLEKYAKAITVLLQLILRKKSTASLRRDVSTLPIEFAQYIVAVSGRDVQKAEHYGTNLLLKLLSLQKEVESLFNLKTMKSSVNVLSGPRLR